ncbi:glycosyltransferase family 2 protein [Pedobacter alpinus]|uniref:Glycosyltransferase family 2 protein n=1 Tax=Pedobacter alpinus TaxID=1590643 RepID=A0ABW5TQI1_9SPHI
MVFNDNKFINRTIDSVISQNNVELEYIIIDGGSTDGTLEKIVSYGSKITVLLSEPDKGIYDAMNKGIALAKGKWLIFMNSGDIFNNNFTLNSIKKYLNEDYDIIYGNTKAYYDDLDLEVKFEAEEPSLLLTKIVMNHQSCIIRKDFHIKNLYNTSYKICADYDMVLRSYLNNVKLKKIDETLALVSIGGVSDANRKRTFKEIYLVQKANGLKKALLIYCKNMGYHFAVKSIKAVFSKNLYNFLHKKKYVK